MWGSFGDITFKVLKTPENIEIEEKTKYATIEVFQKKEKKHFTGFEANKINLSFLFNNSFCNPEEEIQKLQEIKNSLKAENLIIGDTNYGKFVIEGIKTYIQKTMPNGKIMTARIELSLTEVAND